MVWVLANIEADSVTWTAVPYPLRWIEGGLYQLELRSTKGQSGVLAKSPFFTVQPYSPRAEPTGPSPSPVWNPTLTAVLSQ